jgi:DNA-binding protein HU-beta
MNKTELINKIADISGLTKADSERALDAIVSAITDALKGGEDVKLLGFGTFCTAERAATIVRNPKTGVPISIPARITPKFKAGSQLKAAIVK